MINPVLNNIKDTLSDAIDSMWKRSGKYTDDLKGKTLILDLARYMIYLSASDGKIEWSEANKISQYIGLNATPEGINNYICKYNIYSTEFEQTVPVSCELIVECDNIIWDTDNNARKNFKENCGADMLLNLYKGIGEELLTSDNDNERTDYSIYISMLEDYINHNDKFKLEGGVYTGLKKDSCHSSIKNSKRSGVLAPKKQ